MYTTKNNEENKVMKLIHLNHSIQFNTHKQKAEIKLKWLFFEQNCNASPSDIKFL
ncbi:hypothetical protein pb186bvf_006588 [Paramecium bursaria]